MRSFVPLLLGLALESFAGCSGGVDDALERVDDFREAAEKGDDAEVQRIAERAGREDRESDRIARELGLDVCAED